jgi:hypothetical protein
VTSRRRLLALLGLVPVLATTPAAAGSYLDRAGLLIAQSSRESKYLAEHLGDKELAAMIQDMAAHRLNGAKRMEVPREVVLAHPHLLLMLENYERSAQAACDGQHERFAIYRQRARDEEGILRGVLKQLGNWVVPDGK